MRNRLRILVCICTMLSIMVMNSFSGTVYASESTGAQATDSVVDQPKIIVTKSVTNPVKVKAGEEFDLSVTLKNTSSSVALKDLTVTIAPALEQFALCSATDCVYQKNVKAGAEVTITYRLQAKSTVENGQYSLPLTFEYTDVNGNTYTSQGTARVNITSKPQKTDVQYQPKLILTKSKTNPKQVKAGEEFDLTVTLKNTSTTTAIQNMTVSIAPDQTQFAVCSSTDSKYQKKLKAEKEMTVTYRLKAMETLLEGQYAIPITCDYADASGNPFTYTGNARADINQAAATDLQPNVIVTSCGTNPETVKPGEEFDLSLTYKNVSNNMALKNLTVTIAPPAEQMILCDSTDCLYQGNLGSGASATLTYKLKATDIAANGQYTVPLTFNYVDDKGNPYSVPGNARVNIQAENAASEIRINFDKPSMPSEAQIGEIINMDVGVQNLSRVKVYNVRAVVEADGLNQMETLFVGEMEPGTSITGSSQITVSGLRGGNSSYGTTTGTVTFYYEDESGKEYSEVKEITLDIRSPFTNEYPVEQDKTTQWWIIISVVGVIIVGFLVIFLVRRFRGKEGA